MDIDADTEHETRFQTDQYGGWRMNDLYKELEQVPIHIHTHVAHHTQSSHVGIHEQKKKKSSHSSSAQ